MRRRTFTWVCLLAYALLAPQTALPAAEPAAPGAEAAAVNPTDDAAAVEFFEKQVRPILVARCFECHGAEEPKGGLRLDSLAAILAGGDTGAAIVPGKPDDSLLIDAVRYGDLYKMPPDSQLPAEELHTLEQWVARGAPWGAEAAEAAAPGIKKFDLADRAGHWSFQPLSEAATPEVAAAGWIRTPVDRFILAKLEAAQLAPAPAADRRTLLRRVTFDLTGLPPTAAEIDAFINDTSPGAYERVVNRLLDSPHYGERWARHWLDLVRFAETLGHEFDFDVANAFRYRDYVIRALNADLPYNQFVIEHIAGDLLPQPRRNPEDGTNESVVATGWYFFGEAVHSPVDVRADEATRTDNQIDVFSKAFLGLTVSCARCHDHKFDAISTKDYYGLAGYLQSSRYQQASIEPADFQQQELAELRAALAEHEELLEPFLRDELPKRLAGIATSLESLELNVLSEDARTRADHPLYPWAVLTKDAAAITPDEFARRRNELLVRLNERPSNPNVRVLDFEGRGFAAWTRSGHAFGAESQTAPAWSFLGTGELPLQLSVAPAANSGLLASKLQGELRSPTFEITGPTLWYRAHGSGGRVRLIIDGFQLIRSPIYGGLEFAPGSTEPRWQPQDLSKWVGHRAYIELIDDGDGYVALDGVAFADAMPATPPNRHVLEMLADSSIDSPRALAAAYQRTFQHCAVLAIANGEAGDAEAGTLIDWLLRQKELAPAELVAAITVLDASLDALDQRQQSIEARLVSPRRTPAILDGTAENERVFIRGNHKTLGDEVPRRMLEVLGGAEHAPPSVGSGRLELARQLVSPACPLVPRVIVNRLWHHHFGAGLVRSPDDFGVMGQPPTHPELLDYLSRNLVANGWSLKDLHRQMVLSNTYCMASQADAVADTADPQNKLWHRMTIRRLEAESIRDTLLFVSGQLDETMFGPGVKPHLTDFMAGRGRPAESGPLDGDGLRSIYLTVRRNFLPPLFLAFDYPTPFTTIGRRGTSNVPAQALSLMNNPLVIQQAGAWADRLLAEPHIDAAGRIHAMYESAFGRPPREEELAAGLAFVAADDRQSWADYAHVLFNVKEFIYIP